jgi:hypothetical protein
MTTIVRARVAHTPRNPFAEEAALEAFSDGAMAVSDGPPEGSTLNPVLERCESVEAGLGALFTLAREESIAQVRVAGRVVFSSGDL